MRSSRTRSAAAKETCDECDDAAVEGKDDDEELEESRSCAVEGVSACKAASGYAMTWQQR